MVRAEIVKGANELGEVIQNRGKTESQGIKVGKIS